jgi:WD40 repeat protein
MHTSLTLDDFDRFAERARALSGIEHPHVMRLVDAFVGTALIDAIDPPDDAFNIMYTVAQWIPGLSLPSALEATSKASGLRWVSQVARAAAYLHQFRSKDAPAGVVHRDIKPSNIRITPDGHAVLIDFGIARPHQEGDHTEGAGTYLWRAPEVVGGPGDPGPASDAWGVGALAYWVMLAEPPRLEGAAAARELLVPAARSAGFVDPKGLSARIAELLETHPQRRTTDLWRWADEMEVRAAGRRPRPLRRVATIAAVILVLAGGATVAATTLDRSTPPSPSQSRKLAAQAGTLLPTNVALGSLLALASYDRSPTGQARRALVDALEQPLDAVLHDGSRVTSIAYDGGGNLLASGDTAGMVVLWNTTSRSPVARLQVHSQVTSVALSPNGRSVAIGDVGGKVEVWDPSNGAQTRSYSGERARITSVAFNHAGDEVAIGDSSGELAWWNPVSGSATTNDTPHRMAVSSMAVDPDGSPLIAIGDGAPDVIFWDAKSRVLFQPVADDRPVTSIAFSPDGTTFATGDGSGRVTLWGTAHDTVEAQFRAVDAPVTDIDFDPSGQTLAVADARGTVTRWNVVNHSRAAPPFDDGSPIGGVAFSPDGKILAAGDGVGNIVLWSTAIKSATLGPGDNGSLIDSLAFSHGGSLLATANYAGNVDLWDAATAREIGHLHGDGSQIDSVAMDSDGLRLVTGDEDGAVTMWSTLNGERLWTETDDSPVYAVAFSPDGQEVVSGDSRPHAVVRNASTGAPLGRPIPDRSSVRSVAFSPDGKTLALGDDAGLVTLWRPSTHHKIGRSLKASAGHIIWGLTFSANSAVLATGAGDGGTTLWRIPGGDEIRRLPEDTAVLSVVFGHDGKTVITGDRRGDIRAWDVATGAAAGPTRHIGGQVYGLALNADGSTLAVADNSPTATLVPSVVVTDSTAALASSLCQEVRGNLTPGQWSTYVGPDTPYQKVCPTY